jgi:hypothetical protein
MTPVQLYPPWLANDLAEGRRLLSAARADELQRKQIAEIEADDNWSLLLKAAEADLGSKRFFYLDPVKPHGWSGLTNRHTFELHVPELRPILVAFTRRTNGWARCGVLVRTFSGSAPFAVGDLLTSEADLKPADTWQIALALAAEQLTQAAPADAGAGEGAVQIA